MIYGIDVSDNNDVNLKSMRYENDVVYIKATEGRSYVNKILDIQYKKAKEAGYKIGFYHYAWNHPEEEAKFFKSVINRYDYDLKPCIDIEEPSLIYSLDADDFIIKFSKEFDGVNNMLIYTGLSYYHDKINKIKNVDMWIAAYRKDKPIIRDNKMLMWQYTDRAYGDVDRSEVYEIPYKEDANDDEVIKKEEMYIEVKKYVNGSTRERIYADTNLTKEIGSLDPYETCDCLGMVKGRPAVMYKVNGTDQYKIGFAKWTGGVK